MLKTVRKSIIIGLSAAGLCLALPVLASEDSGDPFPEDFNFDDLPEVTPLPDFAAQTETAVPVPEKPEIKIESSTPTMPIEKNETPPVGTVSNAEKTFNQPPEKPIFIPKTSQEESTDALPDITKSLTDTLKESATEEDKKSPIEGTWVEKLTASNPLSLLKSGDGNIERQAESSLEELVKSARSKNEGGKSNASVFDISGIMLRMNLKQTERTLENRGFRKINAKFQIPNFIKWRNEEDCRNQGIVGYERIEACVIAKAKKDKHEYLQYLKYAKFDSKEEIEVYFTSNFTENKVYKIVYKSRIADINGNSQKAIYIRNIKVYDFWKKINQKYGQPDNKTTVTWGLGGDKPYLKASTGYLLLEDPMFREMDYTRMSREDKRFINSDFYNF